MQKHTAFSIYTNPLKPCPNGVITNRRGTTQNQCLGWLCFFDWAYGPDPWPKPVGYQQCQHTPLPDNIDLRRGERAPPIHSPGMRWTTGMTQVRLEVTHWRLSLCRMQTDAGRWKRVHFEDRSGSSQRNRGRAPWLPLGISSSAGTSDPGGSWVGSGIWRCSLGAEIALGCCGTFCQISEMALHCRTVWLNCK